MTKKICESVSSINSTESGIVYSEFVVVNDSDYALEERDEDLYHVIKISDLFY
jgi:hypothetical protein